MLHIISSIAHPMATPFGAYLLRTGGYICVFSTEMLCLTIGSIILVWRLQKYKWNPPKTMVILVKNNSLYLNSLDVVLD